MKERVHVITNVMPNGYWSAVSCEGKKLKRLLSVRKQMQMPFCRSSFDSRSMLLKKNNMGTRMHPCLMSLKMGKLPDSDPLCLLWPHWSSWSWRRMMKNSGGQPMGAKIFTSVATDSIIGLGQLYESCIQTHVLFSAFLPHLPKHEDRVCGPSVGPEPTLAFWRAFLCYHQDQPVQQDTSQDVACNGE